MGARMKPPVHCERCDASSKNMAASDSPEILEDYGMCSSCMEVLMEGVLEHLDRALDGLDHLRSTYNPLYGAAADMHSYLKKAIYSW